MNKAIAIALLVAGFLLIISVVIESSASGAESFLVGPGSPPDKSVWLLLGGLLLVVLGAGGLLRGSKSISDDF